MADSRTTRVRKIMGTPQGKTYTIVLGTFFMLVLMFFLAVRPAFLSITNQNEQNEEKREYIEELTDKENALKQLALQESQYQEEIESLNTFIPRGRNDELLTANLSALADQYNCTLSGVNFNPDALVEDDDLFVHLNLVAVPMDFTTVCPTANQQLMLGGAEALPIPIRIDDISFAESKEQIEGEETLYELSVNGTYYYWSGI